MGAAKSGNLSELKNLFEQARALNITDSIINVQDELGRSALFCSIQFSSPKVAEYIIQLGADVNIATNEKDDEYQGNTPLMLASYLGYISVAAMLIQNGAKVDARRKDGATAAFLASQNDHLEILKLLIQENPNAADQKGYEGRTPLITASLSGHLNIVRYLISLSQTNINSQDNFGFTSLIIAAYRNDIELVKLLLENGADRSIKDYAVNGSTENTALDYAIFENNIKVIELLKH